ncbi:MAG: HopJ type III effector protein [Gammaproteobacteria bacterium]|nr:HopJ type III effector protein [Gammaproteobacteria bacterium]
MHELDEFIKKIKSNPDNIEFDHVIDQINKYYTYTPTQFSNGQDGDCIISNSGENEGSCKVFSFAQLHQLSETQTLNCFGQYYRDDVLNNPDGTDHANIRTFMKYGWNNILFENTALKPRNK